MNKPCLVITGASSGIGHEAAKIFKEKNGHVINLSRRSCTVPGVENYNVDFNKPAWEKEISNSFLETLENYEQITLVHNASFFQRDHSTDLSPQDLRQAFEVNLVAPLVLNSLVVPFMGKGSSVIFVGSTLSEKAVPNLASYCTTKHALVGMMRSFCQDVTSPKIHTCMVCPGFTETEMLVKRAGGKQEILNDLKELVKAKRLITPQEMAEFILYCAKSPILNGSVLHAHLGQVER